MKGNDSFGDEEVIIYFKNFLLAQSSIVHGIFKQGKLDERSTEIKVLVGSACQTATAIAKLSESPNMFSAECVVLARGFLEKVINYCYLIVCDKDEYDRFLKHTIQKSYRRLDRKIFLDGREIRITWGTKIDTESDQVLKEALSEFTSPGGKEKTHWTKVNLLDRIKIICDKSKLKPEPFLMHTLVIYEDASEAIHGTLYGCSFHTGAYDPSIDKKDPKKIKENINKNLTLLLWQLGIAFHQLILLLNEKNDLKTQQATSQKNIDSSFKLMEDLLKKRGL